MASDKTKQQVPAPKEMGHYTEAPGGGKPLPKGTKAPSKQWVKDNRQMQPRDEDGQFTYNAANFHDRKYDYHGKADTDMPWLKGNPTFAIKTGDTIVLSDKTYKALIDMTVKELSDKYKSHNIFADNAAEVNKALETKKGKKAVIAKKAIEEGKEGIVSAPKKGKKATDFVDLKTKYDVSAYSKVKAKDFHFYEKTPTETASEVKTEMPKTETPKPETSKPSMISSASPVAEEKDDVDLAEFKKDPKAYLVNNHKKQVKHLMDTYHVSPKGIVNALYSGQFNKFSDLENYIKSQIKK